MIFPPSAQSSAAAGLPAAGYDDGQTWHRVPDNARSDGKGAAGVGRARLAGGGCLSILRWSGQEAQAAEDGWAGNLLLPTQGRDRGEVPTAISSVAGAMCAEGAWRGRMGLLL